MNATIYYFSGTGNSLKVAKDLQVLIPDCRLVSIPTAMKQKKFTMTSKIVGFVFPVYWIGLPVMVKKFIESIEAAPDTYFFAINTYGLMNGQTNYQIHRILHENGLMLHAGFSLWMPGNNQAHYPPVAPAIRKIQYSTLPKKLDKIAAVINEGRQLPIRKTFFAKDHHIRMIYDDFLGKVATMDKDFYTDSACNHCGVCEKICPAGNIECGSDTVTWKGSCEFCLTCKQWCPQKAIMYKQKPWNKKQYRHPDIKISEMVQ